MRWEEGGSLFGQCQFREGCQLHSSIPLHTTTLFSCNLFNFLSGTSSLPQPASGSGRLILESHPSLSLPLHATSARKDQYSRSWPADIDVKMPTAGTGPSQSPRGVEFEISGGEWRKFRGTPSCVCQRKVTAVGWGSASDSCRAVAYYILNPSRRPLTPAGHGSYSSLWGPLQDTGEARLHGSASAH